MKKIQGEKIEKKIKEKKEKVEKIEVAPIQAPVEPQPVGLLEVKKKSAISINKNIVIALIIIIIIAVIGGLLFYYKSLFIAATVDGSAISRLQVVSELEKIYGKRVLESLVTQKLIDNEAKARGIVISPNDVDTEVKDLETQLKAQGLTLDQALAEQGITLDYLKKQIAVQKELKNMLADQIQVSEDDINQFITENKITIPEGEEENFKTQIKNQIEQEKLSTAANALLESLKAKSKINYFVNY